MNKVFLCEILFLFFWATACNSPAESPRGATVSPTHTIVFTDTPKPEKSPTVAPTASITPALIVAPVIHDLALNETNIDKAINLATFGAPRKTCLNSPRIGSALATKRIENRTEYLLASKNYETDSIEVWNLEIKKQIQNLPEANTDHIQFHPDQTTLISFSRSEPANITLWDIESGIQKYQFPVRGFPANRILISPDGLRIPLIYSQGDGWLVSGLHLQTNQIKDTYYNFRVYYETFPPFVYTSQGSLIAVAYAQDEGQHFIDLSSEKDMILEFPFSNRDEVLDAEAIVSTIAISPDGKYLIGGGVNGNIYIWRTSDGTLVKSLEAHEPARVDGWVGGIKMLEFSPQSNLFLSVGYDGFTKIWDAKTGALLKEINACHYFGGFTQDGRYLVVVGKNGMEVWGLR